MAFQTPDFFRPICLSDDDFLNSCHGNIFRLVSTVLKYFAPKITKVDIFCTKDMNYSKRKCILEIICSKMFQNRNILPQKQRPWPEIRDKGCPLRTHRQV